MSKRIWTVDVRTPHPTLYVVDPDDLVRVYGYVSPFSGIYPQIYAPDLPCQEAQDLYETYCLLWFALQFYATEYTHSVSAYNTTTFVERQQSRPGSLCSLLVQARHSQNPPANLNEFTRQRIEQFIKRFSLGIWKFHSWDSPIKWELTVTNPASLWERLPTPPMQGAFITLLADFLRQNLIRKQVPPSLFTSILVRFFVYMFPCEYGFNTYEYIIWYVLAVLYSMFLSDTAQILEYPPFHRIRRDSACASAVLHAIRLFDPTLFVWLQL